jgi:hypothetical protein
MMRCDAKPIDFVPTGPKLPDYRFGPSSYEYLDRITALCKAHDIELLLLKAPSRYPYWYGEWDEQMVNYADEHGLNYINTLELAGEINLDFKADTYDAGLHLNLYGAEKLSDYLGNYLRETYTLEDHRNDSQLSIIWDKKISAYYAMKEAQLADIELYGAVRTFTYN